MKNSITVKTQKLVNWLAGVLVALAFMSAVSGCNKKTCVSCVSCTGVQLFCDCYSNERQAYKAIIYQEGRLSIPSGCSKTGP